jgi:hypothetical protein
MRPHEPSVVIAAGRSQPPTGNEFGGLLATRLSILSISVHQRSFAVPHPRPTASRSLSHYKLGRTVDMPPTHTRIESRTTVVTPPGERATVALDFAVVSLACRTLGPGKIIAEARRRSRDAEEYGDTATIGNRPSAPLC